MAQEIPSSGFGTAGLYRVHFIYFVKQRRSFEFFSFFACDCLQNHVYWTYRCARLYEELQTGRKEPGYKA